MLAWGESKGALLNRRLHELNDGTSPVREDPDWYWYSLGIEVSNAPEDDKEHGIPVWLGWGIAFLVGAAIWTVLIWAATEGYKHVGR
jgi:hypothetical protein